MPLSPDKLRPWLLLARDAVAAGGGLFGLLHEFAFKSGPADPMIVLGSFAALGVIGVFRSEDKK